MNIKPFEPNDLSQLNKVQPSDWPDITPYFQFYLTADFCFPIKIISDNTLIGTGSIIVHEDVAWLAHIIVSPEHRNKGIGQLITKNLIELAQKKNCTTLYLIATDLGAPVYEKIGFKTETDYLFFKDIQATDPSFTSEYIVPFHPDYEAEIIQFDKLVSGENRKAHLDEHAPKGFVFRKNNQIEGFYLPTFSEGLINASTPEAGMALTKMKLLQHDKISFPKENQVLTDFLYQQGYKEFKTAKRMWLGKVRPLQLDKLYSRIGGYMG